MDFNVSTSKRTLTYELTAEEAKAIVEWYRHAKEKTGVTANAMRFFEPLFAIADHREYGGH
jgi:hypothetical protein